MAQRCTKRSLFRTFFLSVFIAASVGLGGCLGGGGGGGGGVPAGIFGGYSVDGPALSLPIETYAIDLTAANGQAAASLGSSVSNATTGAISISLPQNSAPVIVVGTVDANTTDLSTGAAPYYSMLRGAITRAMETANAATLISLQMNPMTTLAVGIAVQRSNPAAADQAAEFEARLATAADLVMSTFGAGMAAANYDLFTSPTVIEPGMTPAQQLNVAFYRARVLHLNAIIKAIVDGAAAPAPTPDAVLAEIASDLADDKRLNGSVGVLYNAGTIAAALGQNTSTIQVPDSTAGHTPADVLAILTAEAAITAPGLTIDFTGFNAAFGVQADADSDGDGIDNNRDPFPNNAPPLAVNDAYSVNEGGTLTVPKATGVIDSNDTDTNVGDTLVAAVVTNVVNGTLTLNADGSFSYVHNGSETTSDSFTYKVNDGTEDSNVATVTITINPVNDAPVAVADAYTVLEGGSLNVAKAQGVLDANDTDAEGDTLSAVLVTNVVNGTLTLNADGSFTYTHNGSETTQDTFTYHANDGAADSADVTVTITVTPVNDPPVVTDDGYGVNEGATLVVAKAQGVLDSNDTDAEGDALSAIRVSGPFHGTLTLNADGSFTYVHNGDNAASDTFTYKANDGTDDSVTTATVTITVTLLDDAPQASDDGYGLPNAGATINVTAQDGVLANDSDEENDPFTAVTVVVGPQFATAFTLNADGSFSYTHDGSVNTVDTFTYFATANGKNSNTATVTIAINQPPTVVNDAYSVDEGGTLNVNAANGVESNDPADADMDPTTVVLVTDVAHGTLTLNSDGSFSYVNDGSENATDTFTYRRNDGQQNGPIGTVTITINPINDVPVGNGNDGPYSVNEGGTLNVATNVGVLANDTDAETGLTAILVTNVVNGTLTLNADGSFSYVHNGSETTSDSFAYKPNDGTVDGNTVTVAITINPVNDLPVAVADATPTKINVAVQIDVLANDSDAEDGAGANLTIVSVQSDTNGAGQSDAGQTITTNGSSVTYTPANDYFGVDTFKYTVQDANGGQATAIVTVTVNAFPVDLSGIWKGTLTVSTITNGSGCGLTVGDMLPVFIGVNQTANNLKVYTHMDDRMTGTATDNGTTSYPFSVADVGSTTSMTGTYDDTAGNFSGTFAVNEANCVASLTLGGVTKVRGPVADPTTLGGLFGIELQNFDNPSDRTATQLQVDVPAVGAATIHVPGGSMAVTDFDAVAGFFAGNLNEGSSSNDYDGDGNLDSWTRSTRVAGILVLDTASDSCTTSNCAMAPVAVSQDVSASRQLGSATAVTSDRWYTGFGVRVTTQPWYTLARGEDGAGVDTIGVNNPPLDLGDASATLDQAINVLNPSQVSICGIAFRNNLRMAQELPRKPFNLNQPQFQSRYGMVSCSTAAGAVSNGDNLTVQVFDSAVRVDHAFSAAVGALPNGGPMRADFNVNGAIPSQTMVGNTIPLFGYFNMTDTMTVDQMVPGAPVTTPTGLRLTVRQDGFWNTNFGYRDEWRISPDSGVTPTFTIPAGTFGDNGVAMRMQSLYTDGGASRVASTNWINIFHGFVGAAQSELDSSLAFIQTGPLEMAKFQMLLASDPLGLGQIDLCSRVIDTPANPSEFGCDTSAAPAGTVDFANDTVGVTMRDYFGDYAGTANTAFDLELAFSDAATFTPSLKGGTVGTVSGVGHVVNPEFKGVSRAWTNSDRGTIVSLLNPFYELFDSAILYDSSSNVVATVWDDVNGPTGIANYGSRFQLPLDGVAPQNVGGYQSVSSRVLGAGDSRVPADTYRLVLTPKAGIGTGTWAFENTYARNDPAPLDPPVRDDIKVGGTALSGVPSKASTAATALSVGANPFTISWVSTAPANTEWQVIMQVWDTGDGSQTAMDPTTDPVAAQLQTMSLASTDSALSHDANTNTWTWENNDAGSLFGAAVALPDGLHAKVNIRGSDPAAANYLGTIDADSESFWLKHSTAPTQSSVAIVYTNATGLGGLDVTLGVPAYLTNGSCVLGSNGGLGAINGTTAGLIWAPAKTGPFDVMTCTASIPVGAKAPLAADFPLTINQILDEVGNDLSGSLGTGDFSITVTNN